MGIIQSNDTQEFLDLLPEIILEIDINLNIRFLNNSCKKVLGYNKEDFINKPIPINKLVVAEDIPRLKKNIQDAFNGLETSGNSYRVYNNKGEIKTLAIYKSFIKSDGEITGLRTIAVDITNQKIAEETLINSEQRLRELNATKDKFFSIIAHDLKNPFNDVMGFTQLLDLNIEKYDINKIKQFVNIIHQSSKLAYNLLENLLEWSRSQTGILTFKPEKILLNDIIFENLELHESTIENKNLTIYSDFTEDYFAYADKNMIRTVIRNLMSNAIKYTNKGDFIRINILNTKDNCKFIISDSGIGISQENIKKIFKIDESYSTVGTEQEKGTGLGLILCKEFIEKNNGELWAESDLGKGSAFSFTLPKPVSKY